MRTFSRWYYLAGIIGGVLILVAERLSRRAEPSGADVRRAAERYRQWYGDRALSLIGDHMLGARFAPDSRHTQFLKRVVDEVNSQIEGASASEKSVRWSSHQMRRNGTEETLRLVAQNEFAKPFNCEQS